jgi:hypothetical protein
LFSPNAPTHTPTMPPPTKKRQPPPGAIAEAKREPNKPNGHVYEIEGNYGPEDAVPPEAIRGAWKVDEKGSIVGDFIPNPNFKPRVGRS